MSGMLLFDTLLAQRQQETIGKFNTVIRATVKGSLLVAVIQGALGGLAFWFLEVSEALLWGVLLYVLAGSGITELFFLEMCKAGMLTNVVMFAFNLFPLPPLDGGRILVGLLPWRQAVMVSRIEPWGFFIVMALVLTGVISAWWMQPLMGLTFDFLKLTLSPLAALLR